MALTRRSFLAALLGAPAAIALFPSLLTAEAIEVPRHDWSNIYERAHQRAFALFQQAMANRGVSISSGTYPAAMFGDTLPSGRVATRQYGVDFREVDSALDDQTLFAAMYTLAAQSGIDDFAQFQYRPIGVIYGTSIGPLRMVAAYDALYNERMVRFDVFGAQSHAYMRQRERERQARLARDIRRRLKSTTRILPLP